jgi:hypothetical protein
METNVLNENSTEHKSISDALQDVYCQPTDGMTEEDKIERLKELGADDEVYLAVNLLTNETIVIIKHF